MIKKQLKRSLKSYKSMIMKAYKKLSRKQLNCLRSWPKIMKQQANNFSRQSNLIVELKQMKIKNKRLINKNKCLRIYSMVSRRNMMMKSRMHLKLRNNKKIKERLKQNNFKKELKPFKANMRKLVKSKYKNSKRTKCLNMSLVNMSLT